MRAMLLASLVLIGCSLSSPFDDDEPAIVRVKNTSAVAYDDVKVGFPSGMVEYGRLEPGEATAYRDAGTVYRYAYVSIESEGRSWVLQPIDYVGETPLEGGRWTYELMLDAARNAFTIRAVRQPD
jgi:hypothetical protein